MDCPRCAGNRLKPTPMQPGLEIDGCPNCGGIWMDRNEILEFADDPGDVVGAFTAAYAELSATARRCPRCTNLMVRARIAVANLDFEGCPGCGGNWFDKGEVQKLNAHLSAVRRKNSGSPLVALGPRTVSPEESAAILGRGYPVLAPAAAAAALTAAVLAAVVPLRTVSGGVVVFGIVLLFLAWKTAERRRYVETGVLIKGEILDYAGHHPGSVDAKIEFTYQDFPFQVLRRIQRGSPLDKGPRGIVDVLVNPSYPRGAYILALEKDGNGKTPAWTRAERRGRMSPPAVFWPF